MNPADTYTIDSFIAAGNGLEITYYKSSILEKIGGMEISVHNIFYDYMDELKEISKEVLLSDEEYNKYLYAPRLLAYRVYGYSDMYFIIMMLNGISDPKDFNMRKVKMIHPDNIDILGRIINAEKNYIVRNRNDMKNK